MNVQLRRGTRAGFTLVEVLLTLLIMSMIMVSLTQILTAARTSRDTIHNIQETQLAGPAILDLVERDLRGHIAVRKLSYGTRNPRGSLQWAEGTTLSKTLRKQGRRLVDYVPTALAAVANNAPLPSVFSTPT